MPTPNTEPIETRVALALQAALRTIHPDNGCYHTVVDEQVTLDVRELGGLDTKHLSPYLLITQNPNRRIDGFGSQLVDSLDFDIRGFVRVDELDAASRVTAQNRLISDIERVITANRSLSGLVIDAATQMPRTMPWPAGQYVEMPVLVHCLPRTRGENP
jgi:hypothetical protein